MNRRSSSWIETLPIIVSQFCKNSRLTKFFESFFAELWIAPFSYSTRYHPMAISFYLQHSWPCLFHKPVSCCFSLKELSVQDIHVNITRSLDVRWARHPPQTSWDTSPKAQPELLCSSWVPFPREAIIRDDKDPKWKGNVLPFSDMISTWGAARKTRTRGLKGNDYGVAVTACGHSGNPVPCPKQNKRRSFRHCSAHFWFPLKTLVAFNEFCVSLLLLSLIHFTCWVLVSCPIFWSSFVGE